MRDTLIDSLNLDPMRYAMEGLLAQEKMLIQWPRAKYWTAQWNPVIGCKPCSPACANCYAAAWAKRFGQSFVPHETRQRPPRSGVVFCGNMTDLFGEWMWPRLNDAFLTVRPENLILKADSKKATYIWLTKRVENMDLALSVGSATVCDEEGETHFIKIRDLDLSNHFFGFTAENQEWFDRRITAMCKDLPLIDFHYNWWVSAEPLLGELNLRGFHPCWVVVGAESGSNRRPCKIEWVESIVEQCRAANIPVFVKQICLPSGKFTNKIEEFPAHLQIRQVPWATKGE